MSLESIVDRVLRRVEVVDVDEVDKHAGEEMSTVGENNLTTSFNWQVFILLNVVSKDIHHPDSIEEANDNLKASRVECYAHRVILERLIDLKFEAKRWAVAPDLDSPIG